MSKADARDLFDKPKTATDFLNDLERYRQKRMSKAELQKNWRGHDWQTDGMKAWARWNWRNSVN